MTFQHRPAITKTVIAAGGVSGDGEVQYNKDGVLGGDPLFVWDDVNKRLTLGAGTKLLLPLEDDAVAPTLAFGDGDTGFYERVDDDLRISVGGVNTFLFFQTQFRSAQGTGPAMINVGATSFTPTLIPDISDPDTGVGQAGEDQLSLIAGGVEQSRWDVTGNHIVNSLLDAATGNEVALSLSYTTNKSTSGDDTGLVINQTDTASPGTSLLASFQQGGISRLVVTAAGRVGIGTSVPSETLSVVGTDVSSSRLRVHRFESTTSGPEISVFHARGTEAAPTSILSGDEIGRIRSRGFDGTAAGSQTEISFNATQNWAVGAHGADMRFETTANGSTSRTERMRIDENGNVGIGTVTPTSILSLQMGTGSGQAEASGKANVVTTDVGTDADTVEKDLLTYSLPANSLSTDDKLIKITVWGSVAANGNTKTIKLKFGATIIRQIGPSAMSGLDWRMDGLVIRTGAATQDAMATESLDTAVQDTTITTPTETLSGAVVVKVTGQNGTASANDIVAKGMLVEYLN